jgi:hypothetical protein
MERIRVQNLPPQGGIYDRHESEQTSDMVLDHEKRFDRNNRTGVDG